MDSSKELEEPIENPNVSKTSGRPREDKRKPNFLEKAGQRKENHRES